MDDIVDNDFSSLSGSIVYYKKTMGSLAASLDGLTADASWPTTRRRHAEQRQDDEEAATAVLRRYHDPLFSSTPPSSSPLSLWSPSMKHKPTNRNVVDPSMLDRTCAAVMNKGETSHHHHHRRSSSSTVGMVHPWAHDLIADDTPMMGPIIVTNPSLHVQHHDSVQHDSTLLQMMWDYHELTKHTAITLPTDDENDEDGTYWNISSSSSEYDDGYEGDVDGIQDVGSHSWSPRIVRNTNHVRVATNDHPTCKSAPPCLHVTQPNKLDRFKASGDDDEDDDDEMKDDDDDETMSTITASDDEEDRNHAGGGGGDSIDDLVLFLVDYLDCVNDNFATTATTTTAPNTLANTASSLTILPSSSTNFWHEATANHNYHHITIPAYCSAVDW